MGEFITILTDEVAEIVEKKSKFIANIYHVETIEEAEEKIKLINYLVVRNKGLLLQGLLLMIQK